MMTDDVETQLESRVTRLERLIYLLIGLQFPNVLPHLGLL